MWWKSQLLKGITIRQNWKSPEHLEHLQLQGLLLRTYPMDILDIRHLEMLHPIPQADILLWEVHACLQ